MVSFDEQHPNRPEYERDRDRQGHGLLARVGAPRREQEYEAGECEWDRDVEVNGSQTQAQPQDTDRHECEREPSFGVGGTRVRNRLLFSDGSRADICDRRSARQSHGDLEFVLEDL